MNLQQGFSTDDLGISPAPGMPFEKAGHGWGKFLFPAAVSAPIVSYAYLAPH